jgi:hypothetical protein
MDGMLLDEPLVPGVYSPSDRGEQSVYPLADDQHLDSKGYCQGPF